LLFNNFRVPRAPLVIIYLFVALIGDATSTKASTLTPTPFGTDRSDACLCLKSSEQLAAAKHKNVLLVFDSTWCQQCFTFDHLLEDPLVKPVIEANYVVQKLDINEIGSSKSLDNPGGSALYATYGPPQGGVPYVVFLTTRGSKIADTSFDGHIVGMPNGAMATKFFLQQLKFGAPRITVQQINIIRAGIIRINAEYPAHS
jgi:thioredoxin-related protein